MNYQEFKEKITVHKDKIVLGACFVLVFVVGFGSGRYVQKPSASAQTQSNYTTSTAKKPLTQTSPAEGDAGAPAVAGASTTTSVSASSTAASASCIVKGNISSNKKIYHVKGGAFYDRVKPEQCFNTPAEAEAAGFVKSQR